MGLERREIMEMENAEMISYIRSINILKNAFEHPVTEMKTKRKQNMNAQPFGNAKATLNRSPSIVSCS